MMEISFSRRPPPHSVPLTINLVSLSNSSFVAAGSTAGTPVGNITVAMSSGSFTGTFLLSGPDSSRFQVVGSQLQLASTQAAGSYSINIVATQGSASNSPFTQPEVITGSSVSLLSATFTVQEQSGNVQTNMPFMFGLPLSPGAFPSGTTIQVLDGASQQVAQVDQQASDLAGANVRMASVSGVLGSLGASASKQLTVKAVSGSAPTGTAIVASDITGLCSGSFEPGLVTITLGGLTYTASCAAALAAGATWGLTTSQNRGAFRSGPYCSAFWCSAPLVHSGTAHNYLRAVFHVYAFKASSGAVTAQGSGNPIISVLCDVVLENGYVQTNTTTAADLYYGAQIQSSTSLTVATLTLANNVVLVDGSGGAINWTEDSTGAGTLTIGAAVNGNTSPITRSTGTWGVNDNGRILTDNTGHAGNIFNVTVGGTTALLRLASSTLASQTLTSGNYTLHGIGHAYGTRWRQRVVVGAPVATAESTTQTIFSWDGTGSKTTTPYLSASKMIPNIGTVPANVNNAATGTNNYVVFGFGARPYGALNPGGAGGGIFNSGGIRDYFPTSGDAPTDQPGIFTGVDILGAISFDANGQYALFRASTARAWYQWHYRDTSTGLLPTLNAGTDWTWEVAGSLIAGPYLNGGVTTAAAATPHGQLDSAHACSAPYIAYLLDGSFFWLEEVQFHGWFFGWAAATPGGASGGSQLTRNPVQPGAPQARSIAWDLRAALQMLVVTPDAANPAAPMLGLSKTQGNTWISNVWSAVQSLYVNNSTLYASNGPRYCLSQTDHTNEYQFSYYQAGFTASVVGHGKELGYLDANGAAFNAWWPAGMIPEATDTADLAPDYIAYNEWLCFDNEYVPTGAALTWVNCYKYSAWFIAGGFGAPVSSCTISLSATSGSAINGTISGTNPFGTPSFYVGGILAQNGGPGYAKIVSISGSSIVLDTTFPTIWQTGGSGIAGTAFNSTTLTNPLIPFKAPADAASPNTIITNQPFTPIFTGVTAMMVDDGDANASAANTYYKTQCPSFLPTGANINQYSKYYFVPR